eukprot:1159133-Pelagomonas_calceolata.AAC.5
MQQCPPYDQVVIPDKLNGCQWWSNQWSQENESPKQMDYFHDPAHPRRVSSPLINAYGSIVITFPHFPTAPEIDFKSSCRHPVPK